MNPRIIGLILVTSLALLGVGVYLFSSFGRNAGNYQWIECRSEHFSFDCLFQIEPNPGLSKAISNSLQSSAKIEVVASAYVISQKGWDGIVAKIVYPEGSPIDLRQAIISGMQDILSQYKNNRELPEPIKISVESLDEAQKVFTPLTKAEGVVPFYGFVARKGTTLYMMFLINDEANLSQVGFDHMIHSFKAMTK